MSDCMNDDVEEKIMDNIRKQYIKQFGYDIGDNKN